jgi:ABC-2 type transport system permease protein
MLLSGFIFPIESMPAALVPITYLVPLTWAVIVLRGSFIKGVGFAAVAPDLLALAVFSVVIFGVAVVAMRRRLSE